MKKLIYLAISIFFISLGSTMAEEKTPTVNQSGQAAGDTYNFYFQKAPGPTTVNQGTSGTPPATTAPAAPAAVPSEVNEEAVPTTTSRATMPVAKEKIARWGIGFLYGGFRDETRSNTHSSFGLSFDFRFNKMIGLNTGIIKGFKTPAGVDADTTDFFFGAKFMPVHASFDNGGSFEFGLGVGFMTSDYFETKSSTSVFSSDSIWWTDTPSQKTYSATKIVVYAGPQMNILFNRNFGLTFESRFASGKSQHYGAGFLARF